MEYRLVDIDDIYHIIKFFPNDLVGKCIATTYDRQEGLNLVQLLNDAVILSRL